jgi:hypothetical protein
MFKYQYLEILLASLKIPLKKNISWKISNKKTIIRQYHNTASFTIFKQDFNVDFFYSICMKIGTIM